MKPKDENEKPHLFHSKGLSKNKDISLSSFTTFNKLVSREELISIKMDNNLERVNSYINLNDNSKGGSVNKLPKIENFTLGGIKLINDTIKDNSSIKINDSQQEKSVS